MAREYRIDISPEILELLGPSLYTNIYYVLAELIANAYDADAQNVYIIEEDDSITVEDDGIGMDYEVGVRKYLNVAHPTRTSASDEYTAGGRKKMGRKGVGKLAALSVSRDVKVLTIGQEDRSGFVLSRTVPHDHLLPPIPEEEVVFREHHETGTSVIMEHPEYSLHKTFAAQRRNIVRMFPIVNKDFRIHLISGGKQEIIDSFDEGIVPQLTTLMTIGDEYRSLADDFNSIYDDIREKVLVHVEPEALSEVIEMKNKEGIPTECVIEIKGWIGTYKSTTGRRKDVDDFPDNFLSIFANGKLGSFNIIPEISSNWMSESYVVGQLHIDCFERTDLPDMAMSNRQGYKTEDPRYQTAIRIIRTEIFRRILNMREVYTDRNKEERDKAKNAERLRKEAELKKKADEFAKSVSDNIAKNVSGVTPQEDVEKIAGESINASLGILGLKGEVDANKKKLLISHASCDKPLADLIYRLLVLNHVAPEDIIYTSSEDEESRIPYDYPIFDYLRDFFVKSASSQMINVVFVASAESAKRWNPVCEVGAAWVTRADHQVFTIKGHSPQQPLNNTTEWHECMVIDDAILMTRRDADVLKVKIREICKSLGVQPRSNEEIAKLIRDAVSIVDAYPDETNGDDDTGDRAKS